MPAEAPDGFSRRVALLLTGEYSAYNAAFGFACALQARGHDVAFLVDKSVSFVDYVRSNGFRVIEVASVAGPDPGKVKRARRFRLWKRLTEHGPDVLLKQQHLVDLVRENGIDICFIDDVRSDVNLCAAALATHRVPTLLLGYTFSSPFSLAYPPVFSSLVPGGDGRPDIARRAIHALLWGWAIGTKGRALSYDLPAYIRQSMRKLLYQLRDIGFEGELREAGWRSTWSEWKRRPLIPQVVIEHKALDWPAVAENPQRCYFGTSDLWRAKGTFDWSRVDPDRPIVYCTISTSGDFRDGKLSGSDGRVSTWKGRNKPGSVGAKRARIAERYVEVVLECFSRRQDWQLLLACGPFCAILAQRGLPSNIHLFERLPQLAILEKADLAIAWGGGGTIRECVTLGVPMLLFPVWTDQFGNAARVAARGAGIRGDVRTVNAGQMVEMVDRALTDEGILARVKGMQRRIDCDAQGEMRELVEFVRGHTGVEL